MITFRFIITFFVFFWTSYLYSNEAINENVIPLHENNFNKLLNELNEFEQKNESNEETAIDQIENIETSANIESKDLVTENDQIIENEIVEQQLNNDKTIIISKSEVLFDLDENLINNLLSEIKIINSKIVQKEFVNLLSNFELENQQNSKKKIFNIIKKLYEIGEIGKAYKLIKSIDSGIVLDQQHSNFLSQIELNYLFSTYKLNEACELKSFFMDNSILLPYFLLEKTDIFCLILEDKFEEAKLLNSLLLETEKELDQNFQNLFSYMVLNDKSKLDEEFIILNKSKGLIFLYSAMLRVNELPLNDSIINIDPLNLVRPVILSKSTKINTRIKAANKAFNDGSLTIESLSALYQSADFNSEQFDNPNKTIISFNKNNEMIMAFYYQLANIQIFPEDRLGVVLDFWNFAKKEGLEKIAYSITNNIIKSFVPSIQNSEYGFEIALAHIGNKNLSEALKWINAYENSINKNEYEKIQYVNFLIKLNESNNLDIVIEYLSNNYDKLIDTNNLKTRETLDVICNFLNIKIDDKTELLFEEIYDEREMPAYFLIKNIEKNIFYKNDLSVFLFSLVSIDNKNWTQLHPEHLKLILNSFSSYDQGVLIKPIILEILDELEIFNE